MKVLIISRSIGGFGGLEIVLKEFINTLNEKPDITVKYVVYGSIRNNTWFEDTPHETIDNRKKGLARLLDFIRIVRREQPDAIISVSEKFLPTLRTARFFCKKKFSLSYWPHAAIKRMHGDGVEINSQSISRIRKADSYLAISSGIKKELQTIGVAEHRITLIYNPIKRKQHTIPPNKESKTFIYLGRLEFNDQKNLQELVDGFALIDQDCSLHIMGDGPDRERLIRYVQEKGLAERIRFSPTWIKDPWNEIKSADALLLTSSYEGFGMVLAEALSHGIPCISSACEAGPDDLIIHGRNGYLYPPGNPEALKTCILKVLNEEIALTAEEIKQSISHTYEDVYYRRVMGFLRQQS